MATKFIPETKTVTKKTVKMVEAQVVNLPEVGTLIRATLGRTVVYGRLKGSFRDKAIGLVVEGADDMGFEVTFWIIDGWQFEILDEED